MIKYFYFIFFFLFELNAFGCSLSEGYLHPSNYELVKTTKIIVLAEVIGFSMESKGFGSRVHFLWKETLKGEFQKKEFDDCGIDQFSGRSMETTFACPRPGAGTGACNAYDYRKDHLYVLFLNIPSGNKIDLDIFENRIVSGPPFSRINEEVDNSHSAWVQAVRQYIRISELGDYELEKQALYELQARAKSGLEQDIYPVQLIQDIDSHFENPSALKSYSDLMKIYSSDPSLEIRECLFWALSKRGDIEAMPMMIDILEERLAEDYNPGANYFESINKTEYVAPMISIFEKRSKKLNPIVRWHILKSITRLANDSHIKLIKKMLKHADSGDKVLIESWLSRYKQ